VSAEGAAGYRGEKKAFLPNMREILGKQRGLIIAPLEKLPAMQRHGDENVPVSFQNSSPARCIHDASARAVWIWSLYLNRKIRLLLESSYNIAARAALKCGGWAMHPPHNVVSSTGTSNGAPQRTQKGRAIK
jgi:hypothetical protein